MLTSCYIHLPSQPHRSVTQSSSNEFPDRFLTLLAIEMEALPFRLPLPRRSHNLACCSVTYHFLLFAQHLNLKITPDLGRQVSSDPIAFLFPCVVSCFFVDWTQSCLRSISGVVIMLWVLLITYEPRHFQLLRIDQPVISD